MTKEFEHPILTIDLVLFTLSQGKLCVGLQKRSKEPFTGMWALPGGYVHADKDKDAKGTALRVLKDKVGTTKLYLEQLATFSSSTRDPRGWSASIIYYAMVPEDVLSKKGVDLEWHDVDALPKLAFDHADILATAVSRLRDKSSYSSLPLHFFSQPFTVAQALAVYEAILREPVVKLKFRTRLQADDSMVTPLEGQKTSGLSADGQHHRPAQLYWFKPQYERELQIW